jgi:tetratricopeptide (TPR) repeat protein
MDLLFSTMGRTKKELILYRMGIEYCNQGNLFEALDSFSKALDRNSDFSKAFIFKGMVHFRLGQYDESISCYDGAIGINKGNSWAWCNKGITLLKLDRVNEALEAANEAINYAPKNSNAWGIKGDCQFALGQYEEAIESYTDAIELDPEDACNYIGKGESLLSLHRYEEALNCFNNATEIETENAEAWLNKGNAFYEQGMHEKALECLNQALVHNPSEGKALYIKGQVFTSLGEKDNALFCFDEAKKLGFPQNPPIIDHGRIWQITKVFGPKRPQIPDEIFLHEEMQMLLLKLGSEMGFKVWIAKNDKGKDVNGQRYKDIPGFINDFPVEIEINIKEIIELIDVLWLDGNIIRAAFEVESTTSIYSGLLRLSDLILVKPDNSINIYIVAPDERREKVKSEVNRPTFSRLELNKMCYYMPFSKLREEVSRNYKILKYLKPEYINEVLSEPLN